MDTALALTFASRDGTVLEGEYAVPPAGVAVRAAWVLCHPHPQHGGSMRSIVIGTLFGALPAAGVACLRFNYRGVEGSAGSYGGGIGERLDVLGALDEITSRITAPKLVLAGWSFGGDMALATLDPRLAGWYAVAPPLRLADRSDFDAVGGDPRPKCLVLAEHDQFRAPDALRAEVAGWTTTDTTVVGGSDHFFVGRTARVIELATAFVDQLAQ